MLLTKLILALCSFIYASAATLDQSFEPPFSDVDYMGNRLVNLNWKNHGTTTVNSNFIRLTPDRQSKKGAIWSRSHLGVANMSAIIKFRISGQGKHFYGDGLGFWIVEDSDYVEGNLHGFAEKFYGIGEEIIL